jgi:hypothetical protein
LPRIYEEIASTLINKPFLQQTASPPYTKGSPPSLSYVASPMSMPTIHENENKASKQGVAETKSYASPGNLTSAYEAPRDLITPNEKMAIYYVKKRLSLEAMANLESLQRRADEIVEEMKKVETIDEVNELLDQKEVIMEDFNKAKDAEKKARLDASYARLEWERGEAKEDEREREREREVSQIISAT